MKAWVLHGINDIRFEEIAKPTLGKEEVLVKVRAAGICGSDIPRVFTTGAHVHPIVIGHEFAGEVVDAATDELRNKWLGSKVGIFPLIPCRECENCKSKAYEMCSNYNYLGSRCDGGFAEYAAVPAWNLLRLNDDTDLTVAAMLEPMAVATHAMRRLLDANENRKQFVCVSGLGTIGLALTMFLKSEGYDNLLVIGNKDTQKQVAISLGVEEENFCNSKKTDVGEWIAERTASHGIDAFFECIGNQVSVDYALQSAAPSGAIMLVGNPASDMLLKRNDYWKILRRQLTLKGTWNSSYTCDNNDDWHYVLDKINEGKINPTVLITHKLKLDELDRGLDIMHNKTQEYIKIMITD